MLHKIISSRYPAMRPRVSIHRAMKSELFVHDHFTPGGGSWRAEFLRNLQEPLSTIPHSLLDSDCVKGVARNFLNARIHELCSGWYSC